MQNFTFIADMQNIFQDQSNSSMNHVFSETGKQAFHFTGINLEIFGHLLRFADISLSILGLVGIMFMVFSNVGNSGDAKLRGADILIGSYVLLIFIHLFVTVLASYSNLSGGRASAFIFMILAETVLIAGSVMLYFYGVIFEEIAIMSGNQKYNRRSQTAFSSLQYVVIGAGVLITIGGII